MKKFITNYFPILRKSKQIGYLQTIKVKGLSTLQLEYYLDEKYRKKGIMTDFLPNYLHKLKREGIKNLIALVESDNIASKKLLKKNGFTKFATIGDVESYIYSTLFEKVFNDSL